MSSSTSSPAQSPWSPWKTSITDSDATTIRYHGRDVARLMTDASFSEAVFLLHRGRLPTEGERRLIDAILIAVADHGPGSPSAAAARVVATGNRAAPEAAVAAGVLAIGDQHAGAGLACMELLAEGLRLKAAESLSLDEVAQRIVATARARGERLPGLGHRTHSTDPRTVVLFELARNYGLNGEGMALMLAIEQAAAAKIKSLPINIDGALAAVLYDVGFPPLFGKFIFIIGRVAGLTAQVNEEYTQEKPMRIRIPVEYEGEPPRD
jgi:citrate synthase